MYVNILLTLSEQPNATVVPAQSIVTTQQGSYVYVVKSNNTVEQRTVVPSRTIDGDTVVDKGLQPGETIVTDGQVNLIPGAKMEIKNGTAGPPERPAGVADQQAESKARSLNGCGCRQARPPLSTIAGIDRISREKGMSIPERFIQRPIATTLVMMAILLFGIASYRVLPVSDLPNVDYPTINVNANLPGANPDTMAAAVALPLEKQFSNIAGLDSMVSSNRVGATSIVLQFSLDRNLDGAAEDVQAAISQAARQLPGEHAGAAFLQHGKIRPIIPFSNRGSHLGHAEAFRRG